MHLHQTISIFAETLASCKIISNRTSTSCLVSNLMLWNDVLTQSSCAWKLIIIFFLVVGEITKDIGSLDYFLGSWDDVYFASVIILFVEVNSFVIRLFFLVLLIIAREHVDGCRRSVGFLRYFHHALNLFLQNNGVVFTFDFGFNQICYLFRVQLDQSFVTWGIIWEFTKRIVSLFWIIISHLVGPMLYMTIRSKLLLDNTI